MTKNFLPNKSDSTPPPRAPIKPPREAAVNIEPAIAVEIPKSLIIKGRVGEIIKDTIPITKYPRYMTNGRIALFKFNTSKYMYVHYRY